MTRFSARSMQIGRVVAAAALFFSVCAASGSGSAGAQVARPAAASPAIHRVRPATGGADGGTKITISGVRLAHASAVRFGRTKARLVRVSGTTITVVAPRHAAGRVPISVMTRHGRSRLVRASHFTYVAAPVIATMKLPAGVVGTKYLAALTTRTQRAGTWTVANGSLPRHLRVVGNAIAGTPTTAGASAFTMRFVDRFGQSATVRLRLVIGLASAWVATPGPKTAGARGAEANTVACGKAGTCAAINADDEGLPAVLWSLTDGSWAGRLAPLPRNADTAGAAPTLDGVSCDPNGTCVAVGSYYDNSPAGNGRVGIQQGLIETLSHGTWTASEAPILTATIGGQLFSVSCPAAGSCAAVGYGVEGDDFGQAVIDTLAGGSWTTTAAPLPPRDQGSNAVLNGVSCASATSCVAHGVGEFYFTDTLAGHTWTAVDGAPGLAPNEQPMAVSSTCTSNRCVLLVDYNDSNGFAQGELDTLVSGIWTSIAAPVPANAYTNPGVALATVACTVDDSCVVTGTYTDAKGLTKGFIDTNASGRWTSTEAPFPPGFAEVTQPSPFTSSACVTSGPCITVGSYGNTVDQANGLIETTTNGLTASEMPASLAGHSPVILTSVACDLGGACVALGATQGYGDIIETRTG